MPHSPDQKQLTREQILKSARRLFNRRGLSEVTIDELMAEAGLTRGGFYKHFKTKDELYAEAICEFTRADPPAWQLAHIRPRADGEMLGRMIVDAYLSKEHYEDRDDSCPLIGLPSDVARAGSEVKQAYRRVLEMMLGAFAAESSENDAEARKHALAAAALCVGGMVLARATDDASIATELREIALSQLDELHDA